MERKGEREREGKGGVRETKGRERESWGSERGRVRF
jgi:hypothetical protein